MVRTPPMSSSVRTSTAAAFSSSLSSNWSKVSLAPVASRVCSATHSSAPGTIATASAPRPMIRKSTAAKYMDHLPNAMAAEDHGSPATLLSRRYSNRRPGPRSAHLLRAGPRPAGGASRRRRGSARRPRSCRPGPRCRGSRPRPTWRGGRRRRCAGRGPRRPTARGRLRALHAPARRCGRDRAPGSRSARPPTSQRDGRPRPGGSPRAVALDRLDQLAGDLVEEAAGRVVLRRPEERAGSRRGSGAAAAGPG